MVGLGFVGPSGKHGEGSKTKPLLFPAPHMGDPRIFEYRNISFTRDLDVLMCTTFFTGKGKKKHLMGLNDASGLRVRPARRQVGFALQLLSRTQPGDHGEAGEDISWRWQG